MGAYDCDCINNLEYDRRERKQKEQSRSTVSTAQSTVRSTDLIDRGQAIDVVEDYPHGNVWNVESMEEMVDKIKTLPTIQSEPQWIPCSKKMPDEHEWLGTKKFGTTISDEVYVTFENEKGERFCRHMSFQNGELSRHDQFHIDTWFKGSKPIAWMPLPEAYKSSK